MGAGLNSQSSVRVDERITIDDVGPFLGPDGGLQAVGHDMVRVFRASQSDDFVSNDVVGVLTPCQEFDNLFVAIGDKLQFVFHHEGRVQVVRVDGDAQEREKAVLGRDDLVVNLGGTFAVKVEAERRGVAAGKTYRADFQVVAMTVVDHQFVRG